MATKAVGSMERFRALSAGTKEQHFKKFAPSVKRKNSREDNKFTKKTKETDEQDDKMMGTQQKSLYDSFNMHHSNASSKDKRKRKTTEEFKKWEETQDDEMGRIDEEDEIQTQDVDMNSQNETLTQREEQHKNQEENCNELGFELEHYLDELERKQAENLPDQKEITEDCERLSKRIREMKKK